MIKKSLSAGVSVNQTNTSLTPASEMTYIVSSGALNSTHSLTLTPDGTAEG